MVGKLQPLSREFQIVNPDGTPTEYFIRWAQQRQIDIGQGITAAQAQQFIDDALTGHVIQAGTGISVLNPELINDPTVSLDAILGELNDVDLSTPPTDGQVIIWDDTAQMWVPADQSGGGGGGAPWELVYSNSAITNPTSEIDVDVSAYEEILVIGRLVTLASTGYRGVFPSTDGSTFYKTNGDYIAILNAGTETGTFVAGNHETSSSAARDFGVHMDGIRLAGTPKYMRHINTSGAHRLFLADTNPITHIRLAAVASSGGAFINMTGGSVYVFGRPVSGGGGGGRTLISQLTSPTAGTFDFSSLDFTGYNSIEIDLRDIQFSTIGRPGVRFKIGGTVTTNQVYAFSRSGAASGSTEADAASAAAGIGLLDNTSNNWWVVTTATDADAAYNGRITITNPNSTNYKSFLFEGVTPRGNSGTAVFTEGGGAIRDAGVLDGLQIVSENGTISAGTVAIYGVV